MKDVAIKVENLSKRYRIGLKEETKDTLFGALGSILKSPFQNLKRLKKLTSFNENKNESDDIIWALKDISFEVKRGEVLGIIGANGAGKSTLLKILAQITYPTSGRVELNGRVASLLEVGTGFHPELTGRENIYLNGTILGMTKKEIDFKLDKIIEFSGIEKFIDTPVKRYSSGMRVRLAFSVAAHLESDILLIDEVLAVGDSDFRKKAIGKMNEISTNDDRTIVFVSHNMAAVSSICNSAMLLNNGELEFIGNKLDTIECYLSNNSNIVAIKEWNIRNAPGGNRFKFLKVSITPTKGEKINISSGIKLEFECLNKLKNAAVDISFNIFTQDMITVLHHGHLISEPKHLKPGKYKLIAEIPPFILNEGQFYLEVFSGLSGQEKIAIINDYIQFEVAGSKVDHIPRTLPGIIRPKINYYSDLLEIDHT